MPFGRPGRETFSRRVRSSTSYEVGIMYDALGLAGEAGEIADYVKKWVGHGKVFDLDHVEKELGDVLWYVNRMTRRLGKTLRGVAMTNIAKLKARYPQGFSHEASENRKE
jgi:NTP pyrophosphatase (non-canonical NTP hydrolase)